jgi:phosphohistidine phosphatase
MRRLWLLRHAKSSWNDPGLDDHDRPLAARGRDAAARQARFLAREGIRPSLVVCSSALRARETLAVVLPSLGTDLTVRIDPAGYTFDVDRLLALVRALPDEHLEAMLIGHNPAFEDLASTLAREGDRLEVLRTKYPTAALAGLVFETDRWSDVGPAGGRLETFVVPRELP